MADLKTTYKDDVLNTSANEKRKYNMITNEDGTVSLVDATDYLQVGDSFGAADINATNEKVNELNTNLTNENGEQFRYGYQDGKRGVWVKEADTDVFVPFSKNFTYAGDAMYKNGYSSPWNIVLPVDHDTDYVIAFCSIWHYTYHPVINETWFPECTAELIYRDEPYYDATRGISFSIWKLTNITDSVKIYKKDTTGNIGGLAMGIAYP